jgi:hypothetical protein
MDNFMKHKFELLNRIKSIPPDIKTMSAGKLAFKPRRKETFHHSLCLTQSNALKIDGRI